jgi:ABC-type polysaccharide/polyol phosphate export permease
MTAITLEVTSNYSKKNQMNIIFDFFYTLFRYREYLKQAVARDLRKRYKRSFLGYLWSMLNPLLMMSILAIVFSNIMRSNIEDYAVFLFAGMLPWKFFASTANESLNSITNNMNLLNQVPVPKYLFTLAVAFSNLVDFLLTLVPMFLVMLVLGHGIPISVVFLPMILIPLCFTSIAVALIFSVSNVFFKDTQHLVGIILQALYFLSPVLYNREMLPAWLIPYVTKNPMFGIIEMMHMAFYEGVFPDPIFYLTITVGSFLLLTIALWLFRKADHKFIYFI